MMEVTFSLEAFSKIILHVTKYPHNSVNGILLKRQEKGKRSSSTGNANNSAPTSSSSSDPTTSDNLGGGDSVEKLQALKHSFHDVIPVLHMSKYVTPMMELALAQVDRYCKAEHYEIAGYYQANESLDENGPDFVALRIAEKLAEGNPNFITIMVNNDKLDSNLECAPFSVYKLVDGKLKLQEAKILLQPDTQGALSTASALIQAKAYRELNDFDNHLDNITLNYWINPEVNDKIRTLSS